MSATANKNLALPANGSPSWDMPLNNNDGILDTALAGVQVINLATYSGNLLLTSTYPIVTTPLTSMSYIPLFIQLSGALGGNVTIEWPAGITGQWTINNSCSGAFTITLQQVGYSAVAVIPQGSVVIVAATGTGMLLVAGLTSNAVLAQVADIKPLLTSSVPAQWYLCYGQAVSRTTYAALFAKIGTTFGAGDGSTTFNLPDYRGVAIVGLDNMGGSPANSLPGLNSIGQKVGAASHTLAASELPIIAYVDSGHTHTDGGHQHNLLYGVYNIISHTAGSGGNFDVPTRVNLNTGLGYANIQTSNAAITNPGGGGAHSIVQASSGVNVIIYAGV